MAALDIKKFSIVIITGLSGAGKSVAIKSIEDFGGFCVDNMPPELITKFVRLIKTSDYSHKLVALGIDLRTGEFMPSLFENLKKTEKMGYKSRIIFLRAEEKTIIRRYKASRRRHPLSLKKEELKESIRRESMALEPLKEKSDIIIDTDGLNPHELKNRLRDIIFENGRQTIEINITAFGFKYGLPESADMLIDTRFLPNPHYDEDLSVFDGTQKRIKDYVLGHELSREFMRKYKGLLEFLVPNYIKEGKAYFNIAVGCTGGKHRSVVVAGELEGFLKKKGYSVFSTFRDIKNES